MPWLKKGAWLDRFELKASHTHRDIKNDRGKAVPEIFKGYLVFFQDVRRVASCGGK